MAILLKSPVILIIDTEGITRGIAPLLQGYLNFNKKCNIKGVVLNKVKTERHEGKLINAVNNYTDLKILGSIRKNTELIISERHLGLVPANEKNLAEDKISYLAKTISNSLDIKNFKDIGLKIEKQNKVKSERKLNNISTKKNIKIGIFKDKSFGFYYHDDLENFKKLGVDLVPINSIKEKILPKIDGLFIGGGFPEIYAKQIEKNKSLINSVRKFINDGFPVYACLLYTSDAADEP